MKPNRDLFELDINNFIDVNEVKEQIFFNVEPKKNNGVDKALIRFIPWYKNPTKSRIKKFSNWLVDENGKGMFIDCPSTIGEKSPIQEVYWKLKKSENVLDQEVAKKLSRKESNFSLIQVVKYENNPELEGKIFIFRYGYKLNKLIQSELQPEIGEPNNPWNPLNGKVFLLYGTLAAGFNNYDKSKFSNEPSSIIFNDKTYDGSNEHKVELMEYLKANSPNLESQEYKPLDDEQRNIIKRIVNSYMDSKSSTTVI